MLWKFEIELIQSCNSKSNFKDYEIRGCLNLLVNKDWVSQLTLSFLSPGVLFGRVTSTVKNLDNIFIVKSGFFGNLWLRMWWQNSGNKCLSPQAGMTPSQQLRLYKFEAFWKISFVNFIDNSIKVIAKYWLQIFQKI